MVTYGEPDEVEEQTTAEEDEGKNGADEEEEEMVDPLETRRQKCEQTAHCLHARERLEACETRVGTRSHTEEDCTEELFDFLHARDHGVAQKLFSSVNEAPLRQSSYCISSGVSTAADVDLNVQHKHHQRPKTCVVHMPFPQKKQKQINVGQIMTATPLFRISLFSF